MKFMGSKRWMLSNGLGDTLRKTASRSERFVDLFTGSGAVAIYVATNVNVPVHAVDLQAFSAVLAEAVVGRIKPIAGDVIFRSWVSRAIKWLDMQASPAEFGSLGVRDVERARSWCAAHGGLITKAYGGHYFSPKQALWFDALRETLPRTSSHRLLALASLVQAASRCAAAPGHTAQPFQPTSTAIKFLDDAWQRDVSDYVSKAICKLGEMYARSAGTAEIGDCIDVAKRLNSRDLVFIDPPYSGVHYSRFYHVLETLVTKKCGVIEGIGRYPEKKFRPISDFSMKTSSLAAMEQLIHEVSERGASAIVTFPDHQCSNGLSGEAIRDMAKAYFRVTEKVVESRFSTLGGTKRDQNAGNNRAARLPARELILSLRAV